MPYDTHGLLYADCAQLFIAYCCTFEHGYVDAGWRRRWRWRWRRRRGGSS